jgi:hypothetical protein
MANTFKSYTSRNVGTTPSNIGSYTVSANTQVTAIGCSVANISEYPVTVEISLYDGSNSTRIVGPGALVPVGGALIAIGGDQKIVIPVGGSIRVTSSANTSLDAILSVLEIT